MEESNNSLLCVCVCVIASCVLKQQEIHIVTMAGSSYAAMGFQITKAMLMEHVVRKVPSPGVRRALKANMDSVVTFLIVLPLQVTVVLILLAMLGKLPDHNCLVVTFTQIVLFLAITAQSLARVFLDQLFRITEDE